MIQHFVELGTEFKPKIETPCVVFLPNQRSFFGSGVQPSKLSGWKHPRALSEPLFTEQQVRALLATGGQAQAGEVLGWVHKSKSGKIGNHFYTYEPHCDTSVRDDGGEKIAVIAASVAAPQMQADARGAEIDRLNGDLAAIGAGGVESLRKPSTERPSYEFSSKNRDGTWTPWLPLGGGLKFENVKVRQQHTSNVPQGCTAAERPDSPCVALCTTLYDEYCRGCGRHYLEVARWGQMTDVEKGEVWARLEGGSDKCTPSKS